jgi:hypothetical protein
LKPKKTLTGIRYSLMTLCIEELHRMPEELTDLPVSAMARLWAWHERRQRERKA